ncbi:stalk domain-containing protein [Tissierella praeacuta]|uniref:stalk domain-containing protein n=1 Tax=Tissierella praeacuta TaxID=43131 RepID=UPI0028A62360|nr:stalk domain-containing protein [Tissierella praeacuta]
MKSINKIFKIKTIIILIIISIIGLKGNDKSLAAGNIKLVVDGKDITSKSMPIVRNGRTLVPVRFVSEELGATVTWNNDDRIVKIEKGNSTISLKIDSRLVQYIDKEEKYFLSDVAPVIIDGRTYTPLRLVSNALGIGIEWDGINSVVNINSNISSDFTPFFQESILIADNNISGKTELQLNLPNGAPKNAVEIKYLLLDPKTAKGKVIARGNDLGGKYIWLPNIKDNGKKVLVAAVYDNKGYFLSGDAIPVNMNIIPNVFLTGVENGQVVNENIVLNPNVNFVASYVKYEIVNLDKNKTNLTTELDPQGSYKWSPMVDDNGNYSVKVIAYDENNNAYPSEAINIKIEVPYILGFSGVKDGMIIDKPVNLSATRNFNVIETEYILRDPNTGVEEVLKKQGYGSYKWFPSPEYKGDKELLVRVKDTLGIIHQTKGVPVKLPGKPSLLIEGVGPKQVITSEVKLKALSNIGLNSVDYILINPTKGTKKTLASGQNPSIEYKFTPTKGELSYSHIKAVGVYNGKTIESEEIPIKIYLGQTYGPKPIVAKDKFLGVASNLAKESWGNTGMSAALQTAQAILETGWGQSVPVDKYTGKVSNNLFGIKGKGTAGSVISNTWEEYNGTKFRIDAEFRAYNNINESWLNHKELLLKGERYGIFRDVMHDSTQGAWALRRAGYATDSQYPIKLMNIIKQYKLYELDEIGI